MSFPRIHNATGFSCSKFTLTDGQRRIATMSSTMYSYSAALHRFSLCGLKVLLLLLLFTLFYILLLLLLLLLLLFTDFSGCSHSLNAAAAQFRK